MKEMRCLHCYSNEFSERNGHLYCLYCGSKYRQRPEDQEILLSMAYRELRFMNFLDAENAFEDIISRHPDLPEAYWGCVCARYGIKFEQDYTGRQIPTCCLPAIESILEDRYYQKAVELSDEETAAWYSKQGEYLERVRKTWIERARKLAPYDVFISYKDSDQEKGLDRTEDSLKAQSIYTHLVTQGYSVFYSRESLSNVIGEKYEPYIFQALSTSRAMIVYGSTPEYINATWVRNEWQRYAKKMQKGEKDKGSLIVICDGFSPKDLPPMLRSMQVLDGRDMFCYSKLDEHLKGLLAKKVSPEEEARRKLLENAILKKLLEEQAAEEAKKKAEEEAKKKAEEEARLRAEAEARRIAEEEARKRAEAEAEAKRRAEAEAKRKAEEEVNKRKEEIRKSITAELAEILADKETNIKSADSKDTLENNEDEEDGYDSDEFNPILEAAELEIKRQSVEKAKRQAEEEANKRKEEIRKSITAKLAEILADKETNIKSADSKDALENNEDEEDGYDSDEFNPILEAAELEIKRQSVEKAKRQAEEKAKKKVEKKAKRKIKIKKLTNRKFFAIATGILAICILSPILILNLKKSSKNPVQTEVATEEYTVPDNNANIGVQYSSNGDGTCYVCGTIGTFKNAEIAISERSPSGDLVTSIGDSAFKRCTGLMSIFVPDSVATIGDSAFGQCTGLTSIVIPDNVTTIGDSAFSYCHKLTSIKIPENIKSIGEFAFYNCDGLTSIKLPDGVTNIENSLFRSCSKLAEIVIPNSVTSIGTDAFYECVALTSITFQGTKAEWDAIEKGENWDADTGSYTVHCTDGDIPKSES